MDRSADQSVKQASSLSSTRPATVATINLSALAHNLARVRHHIPSGCHIISVVKADAYGHGAVPVVRALAHLGVNLFAVARLAEGVALRNADASTDVLMMGPIRPSEWPEAIAHRLIPVLYEAGQVFSFAECVKRRGAPYPVHVEIDTGMGRIGLASEEIPRVLSSDPFRGILKLDGLMTHLADADNEDPAFTQLQLERFRSIVTLSERAGLNPTFIHAANSAGILGHPSSHFTAVRPGIMLYGYDPAPERNQTNELSPVLTLSTMVVQVRWVNKGEGVSYNRTFIAPRKTRVAVLPIGYADGFSRLLSSRGTVLLHGRRAPVIGRVCMDMTMVDVTEIPSVQAGDEAVLIGTQGETCLGADVLAASSNTIPYEVLCAIGSRVPRAYRPSLSEFTGSGR